MGESPDLSVQSDTQAIHQELFKLLHAIEEQQVCQRGTMTKLAQQWESRFHTLEKTVNRTAEMASLTSVHVNERLAKFVKLGEVLENAVDRAVACASDVSSLTNKCSKVENHLELLGHQIAGERCTRAAEVAELSQRVTVLFTMQSRSTRTEAKSSRELLAICADASDTVMNEGNPAQVNSSGKQIQALPQVAGRLGSQEVKPKTQVDLTERLKTISKELRNEVALRKEAKDVNADTLMAASPTLAGPEHKRGQTKIMSVVHPASVTDSSPEKDTSMVRAVAVEQNHC